MVWSGSEEEFGVKGVGVMGRHCMTCGTHTTANMTAAAFGFNPFCQGAF